MDAGKNGVLDFPKHLRAYLQRMRDDESTHDVVFVVNNQRFPAHRCLVAAASPVLRRMVTDGMKWTSQRDIVLKEVDVDAWKAVLGYMYTGQMNLGDPERALRYLNCADWLQMEELVDVITPFIEQELGWAVCFEILIMPDRPSLKRLRNMAMRELVENFHYMWCWHGFLRLPFDVVLEVLRRGELVVRGELDPFLAVIRWIVWSGHDEIYSAAKTAIAEKVCALIAEHTGVQLSDDDVSETGTHGEVDYAALFKCVDIDEFSITELQIVATICRQLCKEAQTSHSRDLPHVRDFGEKAVEKLIQSDVSKPVIPVALYRRVPHRRNDVVFTFSYRVYTAELRCGSRKTMTSPWFLDKRCNVKWSVEVQRGGKAPTEPGHLGIFLRRIIKGAAEEEESEFGYLIYVEAGNKGTFSRRVQTNSTKVFEGGKSFGYFDFVPLSVLEGQDAVNVGAFLYFKAK